LDPKVTDKWQPLIKQLKAHGLNVHFWPLPGLATAPKQPLALADYVAWLRKKTKNLKSFNLLGHSFGGQLAIRFARLHPDKVSKLILIDSAGLIDDSLTKVIKRLVFKTLAKAGRSLTDSTRLRQLLYRLVRETDYYEAAPTQRETMKNILEEEVRADLPLVKTPTLIIWGTADRVTPVKFGQLLASTIPNSKLAIISGARHSAVYTHPQEVTRLVQEFINKT
jgi:pimeloyl-ACP methyl ester carboxylesterase